VRLGQAQDSSGRDLVERDDDEERSLSTRVP